jgi:DNA repair protein RadD
LLVNKFLEQDIKHRVLILCDRQEILEQDHEELEEYFGTDIGLYSAGLDSFTIEKITVAGIQSIWRKPKLFEKFTIVIIDECDSVNEDDKSMYRAFFKKIGNPIYLGATATPYGLKAGYLHEGKNSLFTCISVDYTRGEKYAKLVEEGYIANIIAFPTSVKFDDKKLKSLGNDYSLKSQSEEFDTDAITRAAMMETVYCGENFKRWLLFTIDIAHAEHCGRILTELGISNCVIHSKMEDDRRQILEESKSGKYRAVINVDVLTIGYNDTKIDLAVLLYCTKSPRKHVQAPGRLRPDPDVPFKAVLDFGGNFSRMGALNDVKIKKIGGEEKGGGGPMMKECLSCKALNHLSAKKCCNCDMEFPVVSKLQSKSDSNAVVIKKEFEKEKPKADKIELKGWLNVDHVKYERKSKLKGNDYLLVTYRCGLLSYKDFVHIEADGFSFMLAKHWMEQRWLSDDPMPFTINGILKNLKNLKRERTIHVDRSGQHAKVIDYSF